MTTTGESDWSGISELAQLAEGAGVLLAVDHGRQEVSISTESGTFVVQPRSGGWFARRERAHCTLSPKVPVAEASCVAPFYASTQAVLKAVQAAGQTGHRSRP